MLKKTLILLILSLVLLNCGGGSDVGNSPPKILSIGQDVKKVTPRQRVTISALLTDPDGTEDIVGGRIKDNSSGRTIGSLSSAGDEGAYQATLSWTQIRKVWKKTLQTGKSTTRQFNIRFLDRAGNEVNHGISITLNCNTDTPCDGRYGNCEDADGDGYGLGPDCLGSDCDDTDADINPSEEEICGNGQDDNCSGRDKPCN